MLKRLFFISIGLLYIFTLSACSNVQEEYTEVYYVVIEGEIYRYVEPADGTASISQVYLDGEGSFDIYIFNPENGETFSFDKFFSFLGQKYVYTDTRTKKHYIKHEKEFDQVFFQFWQDLEAWKSGQ